MGPKPRRPQDLPRAAFYDDDEKDDTVEGPYERYHDNGELAQRGELRDGKRTGLCVYWSGDGARLGEQE
jgi:antitoxin component YwqK of YwqJK toxin-antitoxin module